jgi:mono/diheme cytochrome c family protein
MKILSLLTIIAFALGAFACGSAPTNTATSNTATPKPTAAAETTPVDALARGKALYSQNCAACHKEEGTGGKMTIEGKSLNVDDLTSDKIKKFTDEKIAGYISNGVEDEGMPAFKDKLTGAEISEIIRFVRGGLQKQGPLSPR